MISQEGTEGVALSGKKTSSGRISGETNDGAEGAIRIIPSISQAKGQSIFNNNYFYSFILCFLAFQRSNHTDLAFIYLILI